MPNFAEASTLADRCTAAEQESSRLAPHCSKNRTSVVVLAAPLGTEHHDFASNSSSSAVASLRSRVSNLFGEPVVGFGQHPAGLFWVDLLDQLHRALDVGEQGRNRLALAVGRRSSAALGPLRESMVLSDLKAEARPLKVQHTRHRTSNPADWRRRNVGTSRGSAQRIPCRIWHLPDFQLRTPSSALQLTRLRRSQDGPD
jgi:hypothetical protein